MEGWYIPNIVPPESSSGESSVNLKRDMPFALTGDSLSSSSLFTIILLTRVKTESGLLSVGVQNWNWMLSPLLTWSCSVAMKVKLLIVQSQEIDMYGKSSHWPPWLV